MTDFETIYHLYFEDVYRYIRKLSGSGQIAEEITSETFFKAIQTIDSFRGECDLRVWLCQIAKNCYFTQQAKAQRNSQLEDWAIAVSANTPEQTLLQKEEAMRIRKILHNIPDPYKEVFLWRVFAELSFHQIGSIFQKSENWACVTYHRARKMILQRLEGQEHEK